MLHTTAEEDLDIVTNAHERSATEMETDIDDEAAKVTVSPETMQGFQTVQQSMHALLAALTPKEEEESSV